MRPSDIRSHRGRAAPAGNAGFCIRHSLSALGLCIALREVDLCADFPTVGEAPGEYPADELSNCPDGHKIITGVD